MIKRLLRLAALLSTMGLLAAREPAEPEDKNSLLAPGIAAMEELEFEKALSLFTEAAKQAPYDPKVLYAIGGAHAALGHNALAAIYIAAYLKSWGGAPDRQSSEGEINRHALNALVMGQTMLALV